MAEESGGDSWWGAWGTEFLSNVKAKSAETLSLVKQDLSEFVTTIQHDTTVTVAETAATVKDKLKVEEDETDSSTTAIIRQGMSQWLGSISTALKENVSQMTAIVDEEPTNSTPVPVFDRIQARVHEIQTDPSTYCNEPDGHPTHFEEWCEKFDIDQHKAEISELLVNRPEIRSLYTKLVPSAVTNYHFWTRYFYKIYRFEQEEKRKAALVERAIKMEEEDLGWGDEEDGWDVEDSSKDKTEKSTIDDIVHVQSELVFDNISDRESENQMNESKKQNDQMPLTFNEEAKERHEEDSGVLALETNQIKSTDEKKLQSGKIAEDLPKDNILVEKSSEKITSSEALEENPLLTNKTESQSSKENDEGPRQSSTPNPCIEENQPTTSEPVKLGSNDELNKENSSNSSVDSSWSKISEEDLKQNNGKKTEKDTSSRHLLGPSPSHSEQSTSSMVIVPPTQDKDVIDIDWDDDDDEFDEDAQALVNSTDNKDAVKSTEIDDDDDDWENWE